MLLVAPEDGQTPFDTDLRVSLVRGVEELGPLLAQGHCVPAGAIVAVEIGADQVTEAISELRSWWSSLPIALMCNQRSASLAKLRKAHRCESFDRARERPQRGDEFVSRCLRSQTELAAMVAGFATDHELTPCQEATALLLASGLRRARLRRWLGISTSGCKKHVGATLAKAGATSSGELLQLLLRHVSSQNASRAGDLC